MVHAMCNHARDNMLQNPTIRNPSQIIYGIGDSSPLKGNLDVCICFIHAAGVLPASMIITVILKQNNNSG
jgi:hypothetical protein